MMNLLTNKTAVFVAGLVLIVIGFFTDFVSSPMGIGTCYGIMMLHLFDLWDEREKLKEGK